MTTRMLWAVALLGLVLSGCPESEGGGQDPDLGQATDGGGLLDQGAGGEGGQGGEGGAAGMGGMGGEGGAAGMGGAGGMGGQGGDMGAPDEGPRPDMFAGVDVESCQDACDRYAGCERLVELFGDEGTCLAQCERLTRGDAVPENWWSCLEFEQCNLIQLCRVPEPEPLSCAEVCASAAGCGLDVPGCQEACEASDQPYRACGEALFAGCDVAGFTQCLGRDVYPRCGTTCARAVGCNILPADTCLVDCVAAEGDPDPLFSLRATQRNACVARAVENDCLAINDCINPPDPGEVPVVNPQIFCARWSQCGFDDFFPCQDLVQEIGQEPGFLACAYDAIRNACPRDPFQAIEACFEGGGGNNALLQQCGLLCEARDVCGALGPNGRPACVNDCSGGNNADPDEAERAAAALACAGADRCPELDECLAGVGPGADCAALCGRLDECGQGSDDCEATCDAQWPRDRHAAYRACVADAPECADVAECSVPAPPPCAAYCAAAVPCGVEREVGCEARCDDEHFANPAAELLYDACVIAAAPQCRAPAPGEPSVNDCRNRPQDGLACLGYCRARIECGADERDLGECIATCGDGFVGDDGLRFRAGRDCLRGLAADASCEALDACVPDELDVDCAAFCGQAQACAVELTDCEGACAEDPLARLRVLVDNECLVEADGACPDVRACLVTEVTPPAPGARAGVNDPAVVCPVWRGCGLDDFFGPCEELLQEFGQQAGVVECIYDLISNQCPRDPGEIFVCLEGGQPQVNPIAEECEALCEARAFCGDAGAQDQAQCRRTCEAQANNNVPDPIARLAHQLACAGAWSCPDLATCLENSTPAAVCADHCAALAECGAVADEALCVAECDRDFGRLREFDYRACVRGALAEGCAAVQACERAPTVPCEQACEAQAACGAVPDGCAAACDDQHFVTPLESTLEVACLLSAQGCEGEGSVPACFQDPGPGARACLGFCRATTGECNPEADDALLDCMNGCVAGFDDADGLRFAAARECLSQVNPEAPCPVLQACLPAEVQVDCPAYCGELEACRIPAEGCAEACGAGEIGLDQAGCVADARRAAGGCAAVAECVDFTPPPASPACVNSCELRRECDRATDGFLCRLACTPEPEALPIQLACADVLRCGDALDACFNLPADLDEDCVAACDGVPDCGIAFGDALGCAQRCTGQVASGRPEDGWPGAIAACLEGAINDGVCDAETANACFNVGVELGANRGFGHHGSCNTFNQCNDAQTCANAACALFGHGPALSWEEGLCMDLNAGLPGGMDCDLFNQLPGPLDDDWGGFCNIPVAYDVVCLP